ncbi:MAG: ATP-binding cassette domain-containing protein [Syntrophomonadaceae bacterium]|nr:ATP-binding cassette domain-containing protein [Syntrophomonadaceae bacterium]
MPIELERVSYVYAPGTPFEVTALEDVSLKIGDGEFVGIMGHTGCGKTTMIQLIAGLMKPVRGKIMLDGKDINERRYDRIELRRSMGIVFQYPEYQLFETTVEKDVAFGLKHSGMSRNEVKEQVRWALEMTGFVFETIRSQSPLALSGGEKRRVAVAGVLAVKPKIMIFDEPIAGLDPLGRELFLQLASRLNQSGTTVIIVSHNADALGDFAKRLVVLDKGRILMDGSPREVFSEVARMQELRLGVSTPRQIADMLYRRGVEVPQDIVTYNELFAALKSRLTAGDKS